MFAKWRWTIAILAVLAFVPAVRGQDNRVKKKAQEEQTLEPDPQLQRALDAQSAWQQKRFTETMHMRVDEAHRVYGLSDAQRSKLKTAAKGVVTRSMQQWRKGMAEMFKQRMNRNNALAARAAAAQPRAAGLAIPMTSASRAPVVSPEKEALWTKTLEMTLSADQKKVYDAHLAARAELRRKTLVQSYVDRMDSKLLLTDNQRKKLMAALHKAADEELQSLPGDTLKSILSELQCKRWQGQQPNLRRAVLR